MRFLFFLIAIPALATNYYVRDGGSSSSCTDWNTGNVCDQITTALGLASRGDTIYVADGSYSSISLSTAVSSTTTITIAKATVAAHGTSTGWSDTYGDGQATISDINASTAYWVIDGKTRNESDWTDGAAYGFRITGTVYSSALNPGPQCADNLTVRYVNIGANGSGNTYSASYSEGFYNGGFGNYCQNWTVDHNYIHHVTTAFQCAGCDGHLLEYNYFKYTFSKEAFRGQIRGADITIRYNIFQDACQATPGEPGSGCTAEIGIWDDSDTAGSFDGNEIYGNVIYKTTSENNSSGCIFVGGDGSPSQGVVANNTLIYNNTCAGLSDGNPNIIVQGGTGNICRDNLWYDVVGTPSANCNTANNNSEASSDPFVNYASGNFRLTGHIAGASLSSPYDYDMDGVMRGYNGTWDQGAFQYVSGASVPTVTTTTATSITSTTASSGGNVTSDGGDSVTARGVCYGTSANPTTPCTSDGTGTGSFSSSFTSLTPSTTYHYRAFATNGIGTAYGSDLTFMTDTSSTSGSATFTKSTIFGPGRKF